MNDLDLCLEVVSRSCEQLRYIRLWISRKPLEIEAWFQRTTNRKLHMGYQMVTWPMASRTPKVLWGSTVGYPSDSLASCYCFVLKCKTHHIGMVDADFFSSKRNSLTRNRLNRTTTVLSLSLSLWQFSFPRVRRQCYSTFAHNDDHRPGIHYNSCQV